MGAIQMQQNRNTNAPYAKKENNKCTIQAYYKKMPIGSTEHKRDAAYLCWSQEERSPGGRPVGRSFRYYA